MVIHSPGIVDDHAEHRVSALFLFVLRLTLRRAFLA